MKLLNKVPTTREEAEQYASNLVELVSSVFECEILDLFVEQDCWVAYFKVTADGDSVIQTGRIFSTLIDDNEVEASIKFVSSCVRMFINRMVSLA